MRTLIAFLMAVVVVGRLSASPIVVVATTPDLAEFARVVGGNAVEVSYIVRGSQNPHYIDVKPSFMMKLRSADIFLTIGLQLELWVPPLVDGSRNARLRVIDCSRDVAKLEVPSGKIDASEGDVHPLGNPHYWLDPANVRPILEVIVEAFSRVDPGRQSDFRRNADAYLGRIDERLRDWKQRMAPYEGRPVVTYHSSFSYLMRRFGLVIAGHVEPKPGIPPTPAHTASLVQLIRDQHIRVIGVEQYFEENVPASIARSSGATVVRLCTSIGGREGIGDYPSLIEYNVSALISALQVGQR